MDKLLNKMPVPTWNNLKINFSDQSLFELKNKPKEFDSVKSSISGNVKELDDTKIFEDMDTGVGEVLTNFAKRYSNSKNCLLIDGTHNQINFEFMLSDDNPVLVDEHNYYLNNGSSAVIIQNYLSEGEDEFKHTGSTKLYVGRDADVTLIQVQFLNKNTEHFSDIGLVLEKDAKATIIRVEMGGKSVVSGCMATMKEDRCDIDINTLYYGDRDRIFDFNDVARHLGKKTNSIIKAQGALFDNSKKIYRGTIDFVKGSKYASGDESENTLVFSPNVINKSAPVILCQEHDVEGHHAASIGRIDENLMFYMQTRGFEKEEVMQMMVESNFNPTIDKIPDENIREAILRCIKRRRNDENCLFK